MIASMEYMLAGLPVVSTNNLGGRDVYFDDDYCVKVGGNASAVAEAVSAVIARKIPSDLIRSRTIERIRSVRATFVEFLNAICSETGSDRRFSEDDIYPGAGLPVWRDSADAVKDALSRTPNRQSTRRQSRAGRAASTYDRSNQAS